MSNNVSKSFSSMEGVPDDYWAKEEYWKVHKCCWVCNKENGRIIEGKFCSEECQKINAAKYSGRE